MILQVTFGERVVRFPRKNKSKAQKPSGCFWNSPPCRRGRGRALRGPGSPSGAPVQGPGQAYRRGAVWGGAPGQQQLNDVRVVVMDGHVQGCQAVLQGSKTDKENNVHSADFH